MSDLNESGGLEEGKAGCREAQSVCLEYIIEIASQFRL